MGMKLNAMSTKEDCRREDNCYYFSSRWYGIGELLFVSNASEIDKTI